MYVHSVRVKVQRLRAESKSDEFDKTERSYSQFEHAARNNNTMER